jgi:hypothetical protein
MVDYEPTNVDIGRIDPGLYPLVFGLKARDD